MGLVAARISSPWRRNQRETTSGHPVGPTVASRMGITDASRKSSTSLGAKGPRRLAMSTPARLGRPLRGGRIRHDLPDPLTAKHQAVKERVEDSPVSNLPMSIRAWSRPSSASTPTISSATSSPSRASLSAHAAQRGAAGDLESAWAPIREQGERFAGAKSVAALAGPVRLQASPPTSIRPLPPPAACRHRAQGP